MVHAIFPPSNPHCFDHSSNIWLGVQTVNLLPYDIFSTLLLIPSSQVQYLLQRSILEHP